MIADEVRTLCALSPKCLCRCALAAHSVFHSVQQSLCIMPLTGCWLVSVSSPLSA